MDYDYLLLLINEYDDYAITDKMFCNAIVYGVASILHTKKIINDDEMLDINKRTLDKISKWVTPLDYLKFGFLKNDLECVQEYDGINKMLAINEVVVKAQLAYDLEIITEDERQYILKREQELRSGWDEFKSK